MENKSLAIIIDLNAYLEANGFKNRYVLNDKHGWILLSDKVGYICKFKNWYDCYDFLIPFNWGVRSKF